MSACSKLAIVLDAARKANDAIERLRTVEDELAEVLDGLADHDCDDHREDSR